MKILSDAYVSAERLGDFESMDYLAEIIVEVGGDTKPHFTVTPDVIEATRETIESLNGRRMFNNLVLARLRFIE